MVDKNKAKMKYLDIQVSSETYCILEKMCDLSRVDLPYLLSEVVTQFADDNLTVIEQLKQGYQKMGDKNQTICQKLCHLDEEMGKYLK